ncbi:MAG: hypothetical protein LBL96_12510 [Clostridiales bacterium]|jgi:hypothetical protein|nr:hypothetical protein [Clostridiales bacterium]
MKIKIILLGGKAQNGKTSAAAFLAANLSEKGMRVFRIAFADYVKYVCAQYFDWDGAKDSRGRHILQYVGTEIVRSRDEDFWSDSVVRLVKIFAPEYDYVLIDDWRFPNEYTRWAHWGMRDVITVRVQRKGFVSPLTISQQNHASETALDGFVTDHVFIASNLNELREQCEIFARDVLLV